MKRQRAIEAVVKVFRDLKYTKTLTFLGIAYFAPGNFWGNSFTD